MHNDIAQKIGGNILIMPFQVLLSKMFSVKNCLNWNRKPFFRLYLIFSVLLVFLYHQTQRGEHELLEYRAISGILLQALLTVSLYIWLYCRFMYRVPQKKRGPFGFAVTQNISEYQNIRIYPKLLITVFVSSYGTNLDLKF